MLYAQVIVKSRTQVQTLTYALSAQIIPYIKVGSLVAVPLRHKEVAGVVVSFSRHIPAGLKGKIKEIANIAKGEGIFTAAQIAVIHQLADYYAAPLAEVAFHALDWPSLADVTPPAKSALFRPLVITGPWSQRCQAYQQIITKAKGRVLIIFAQHNFADDFISRLSSLNSPYDLYDIRSRRGKKFLQVVKESSNGIFIGTLGEAFFPLQTGDTIIVDQPSHIGSTSQLRPFMAAKQIALVRAQTEHLQLVLGDTLASLDDLLQIQAKQFRLVASKSVVKPLTIIDRRGQTELIAPNLFQDLHQTVASGGRALVIVLARGSASALVCTNCGHTFVCPKCARTTGVFGDKRRCLYCRHETDLPTVCSNCRGTELKTVGEGVTAVTNYLVQHLPGVSVAELSSDQAIYNESARVTVATEKILTFPDATFDKVYLVSVDRLLSGADLDGSWRLLSFLLEWQSRAKGIVIQTYFPDSVVWSAAASGNLRPFFTAELTNRRQLNLPPYGAVIGIRGSANTTEKLLAQANKISAELLKILPIADISYPTIDNRAGGLYHAHFTLYLSKLPVTSLKLKLASILSPAWHLSFD